MFNKLKTRLRGLRKLVPPLPALALAGVIALAVGFGLILWIVPQWQTPADLTDPQTRANFENEARRTIAQILLGALVLVGLYFTWRRVRAADQTVEVTREQQITERFTRAVEQLGNDKLAIRLGGIYALERIAKDSAKDHWQVMEVLTAYVRENARWEGESDENGVPVSDRSDECRVATDIQAILTVLGRRKVENENHVQSLDLSGTDLRGADLGEINVQENTRWDSTLTGARLLYEALQSGKHGRVLLNGANLERANLSRAYLIQSNLQNANLSFANISHAVVLGDSLVGSNLKGATLEGTNFLRLQDLKFVTFDENTILPDYLRKG